MASYHSAGVVCGELLKALLLVAAYHVLSATGQQVGVSLKLRGEVVPNDSLVDIDDIMYTGPSGFTDLPSNRNPRDEALKCVTDLVDCCGTESDTVRAVHGDWYLPDGTRVAEGSYGGGRQFLVFRGPNEVIDGSQFYGSVRLYRRYTPLERGRFRCELPNAADPGVNQTLYANILNFGFRFNLEHVTISPSTGSATAGQTGYSLTCSSTLFDPSRLPSDVPSPNFQWSFNGSASLPSGVTAMPTVMSTSNSTSETYSSILQFSPLSQSLHTGMYTCRLGAGILVNSAMVTVNEPVISVQIIADRAPLLLEPNDYSLLCNVNGAENLNASITYQWSKGNGNRTQIVGISSKTLSFSHLLPSDAGLYSCNVSIYSAYLSTGVHALSESFEVTIIIPESTVSVHSDSPNPILSGSSLTLTCTVELKSKVTVPLAVSTELTGPDGTVFAPSTRPEMISFTLYSSSYTLDSVESAESGEYTCMVKIEKEPEVYTSTSITTFDGMFQLRLKSVGICQQWYSESSDRSEQYSSFIKEALIEAIERHCKCRFPIANLLKINKDLFICEDSPNLMVYRNALLGTLNFNGTEIIGFIQDWVSTGPLIKIDGNPVRVDSSCPTAISSLDEPVCIEKEEECLCDNDPKYAMCAQHLDDNNVGTCFEGCIVRNG